MKVSIFLSSYYVSIDSEKDSYLSGPSLDLFDYLNEKRNKYNTVYFRFPLATLLDKKIKKTIIIHEIINGLYKERFINFEIPFLFRKFNSINIIISKFLEIFFITKYLINNKINFDIFFTTDSIQFLTTYLFNFKNRDKIKKVYDVIDYSPRRYISKIYNFFFIY